MAQKYTGLIGRQREQNELERLFGEIQRGRGGLVLLAGEAGVGKTRLAAEGLAHSGLLTLKSLTSEFATPPYGLVSATLRAYLRLRPDGLEKCGPLLQYLTLLLPELGAPPDRVDPAALDEAIGGAFKTIAQTEPTIVFLDDLQWADNATLALLPKLASLIENERLLILATYRSDEIGRGHPLRRMRNDLRRARLLHEIVIEPLELEATTNLATSILGGKPGPALAKALYERTEGLPLFVEELARALTRGGYVRPGPSGLELNPGLEMPIPENVRDAVLLQLDGLDEAALNLLEIAAVAGTSFDLKTVIEVAGGEEAFNGLVERGLISESEAGRAAFRHALTREAIYKDISWARRRLLHRHLAERLEKEGVFSTVIAEHWLAGQQTERARVALVTTVKVSSELYAYRDAILAAQRALNLWPEGEDETGRLGLLDRLGYCAQLGGMLSEAAQAWRESAAGWRLKAELLLGAEAESKLANVCELQGHWERAMTARTAAAEGFAASNCPAQAAQERLTAAAHLRSAARYRAALELLSPAFEEAEKAQRWDLKARVLGLQGNVLARMGQFTGGLLMVRQGLALALEHNLAGPAGEIYQRLADSLEHAGDYSRARETYMEAFSYCQTNAVPVAAQVCIACLSVVLRHVGEWEQAATLCRQVLASEHISLHARAAASGTLGTVYALRGQPNRARPALLEAAALARQIELAAMEVVSAWGLAIVAEQEGDPAAAIEQCRFILNRWGQIEDCHYAIPVLRWLVTFCAVNNHGEEARAGASALAEITTKTGQSEALSALGHALGEIALLENQPAQAVEQFNQSLEMLRNVQLPYCYALTQFRTAQACLALGQSRTAIEHLSNSQRLARKLGARPLASQIASTLKAVDGTPGQSATGKIANQPGSQILTRRQLEILRLVALGQTTPQIARDLFLSPRTVDMHIANILAALDCRSRAQAVRKAAELKLLA